VRCWRLGRDEQRFEAEYIQSGERTVVASLAAACAWISDRARLRADHRTAAGQNGPDAEGEAHNV
jgi:hypothetical protein